MTDASTVSGAATSGATPARIVHRTRERLRLRLPSRRHDLPFFLALYDDLRGQPEIEEVTINPATGSVLVWFAPFDADQIEPALMRSGRLQLVDTEPGGEAGTGSHGFYASINNMRILLFLLLVVLSIQQLMKGQLLAPALTLLLYVADFVAGIRLEHAATVPPPQTDNSA
jgi:hypothetical protein